MTHGEIAAMVRRAVNMRLNGATYDKITRVCGFETVTETIRAIDDYTSRWFSNG